MTRGELILTIWEFGMDHPNFSLNELEKFLEGKPLLEEDINFGKSYVEKNFIKSKDLDEYLIDQNSITGFLTHKQNKIARGSMIIAILSLIVAILSLIVALHPLFLKHESGVCQCFKKNQVQQYQTAQHDTVGPIILVATNYSEE